MANADSNFDTKVKKLVLDRSWYQISDYWLSSIPRLDPDANFAFEVLENFKPLVDILSSTSDAELKVEIVGLRETVFREAIFLFHKSINVLSIAELNANRGNPTWSLSTAYHSAFFGARALTRLLGVANATVGGKNWVIDIYPQWVKSSKRKRNDINSQTDILIFESPKIEQRHHWRLFQRLARVTKFDDKTMSRLADDLWKTDEGDLTKQRHALLYGKNVWFFNDLYQTDIRSGFGIRTSNTSMRTDAGTEDFTIFLAYSIVEFGIRLLRSIGEKANILKDSLNMIEQSITSDRHPIYNQSRGGCFVSTVE